MINRPSGLPAAAFTDTDMIVTDEFVRAVLPELKTEYNKFDRGRLLLIAGSYGMAGAAILASKAALRAGVGYLNLAVPKEIYEIVAKVLPEAVFTIYEKPEDLIPAVEKADCVAVGPGLSGNADRILPVVTAHVNCPLLLDADGLNALSRIVAEKGVPLNFSGKLFMTPHEGEMARLLGVTSDEVRSDKEGALRQCIEKYHATVLLKGAGTLISDPEKIETEDPFFVNSTGNPGMAVAGSGDVLTGIAGSLIAQENAHPKGNTSGILAASAFIHGKTGDSAAKDLGVRSCRPEDFIERISAVLKEL